MQIKAGSSRWLHETGRCRPFAWPDGYGAFTVSASRVANGQRYIQHQGEHHRKRTFQEEYVDLLREAGIAFDERYLW